MFLLLDVHFPLFYLLLAQEVLACFHFYVLLSWGGLWGEWRVLFLLHFLLAFFLVHLHLLEFGEVFVPVLVLHFLILHELTFYHQLLDMVDWMDILHGVHYDPSQYFNVLEATDETYCASLNQDVAFREQFKSFEGITVGADKALPSFYKSLFVADVGSNFNDFAEHAIFHESESLLVRDTSRYKLDHIPSFDNSIGVPSLLGCPDCHGPLKQIELELDPKFHQFLLDYALALLYVLFPVLGEQYTEATFLQERTINFLRVDGVDLPMIDIGVVPGLIFSVPL